MIYWLDPISIIMPTQMLWCSDTLMNVPVELRVSFREKKPPLNTISACDRDTLSSIITIWFMECLPILPPSSFSLQQVVWAPSVGTITISYSIQVRLVLVVRPRSSRTPPFRLIARRTALAANSASGFVVSCNCLSFFSFFGAFCRSLEKTEYNTACFPRSDLQKAPFLQVQCPVKPVGQAELAGFATDINRIRVVLFLSSLVVFF